jgi:hypothetical protein
MRFLLIAAALALPFAAPSARAADEMGTPYEKTFETSGMIVDLVCDLTGSCPANCGAGKRQLGVKLADGSLLPIVKGATIFANGVETILPYCGKTIILDGLLVENPKMRVYDAQRIKENAAAPWRSTEDFEVQFQLKYGKTDEWYRKEPRVAAEIAETGKLGIKGLEIKK